MSDEKRGHYSITWSDGEPTRLTGWCAGCGQPVSERDALLVASEPPEIPQFDQPLRYTPEKRVGVYHAACVSVTVPFGEEVSHNGLRWRVLTFPRRPLSPHPKMTDETTPLPAGRALDALVAEKVMGWTVGAGFFNDHYWAFSTNIDAAWLVVERLGEMFDWVSVARDRAGAGAKLWTVECADHTGNPRMRQCVIEDAETAPLAISRAAVRACTPQDAEARGGG